MARLCRVCLSLRIEGGSQRPDLGYLKQRHFVAASIVGVRAVLPDALLLWETTMSISNEVGDSQAVINEVDRVCIVLPPNATFYSAFPYIAVAFDAGSNGATPKILGRSELPYLAKYRIFSELCQGRAIQTVDHRLVVNSKPVTPETYLGLWRKAITQALTPTQFTEQYGLKLIVLLGGFLEGLREVKSHWTSSPFATFADFEAAYAEKIQYMDSGRQFRLELVLGQENAARDAFYGESLISSKEEMTRPVVSMTLRTIDQSGSLHSVGPAAQVDLFTTATEGA